MPKIVQKYIIPDFCLILIFNPRRTFLWKLDGHKISGSAINSLLFNNGQYKFFESHNKITKINKHGVLCFIIVINISSKYSSLYFYFLLVLVPYIYSNNYYQSVYSGDLFIATKVLLYIITSSHSYLCGYKYQYIRCYCIFRPPPLYHVA